MRHCAPVLQRGGAGCPMRHPRLLFRSLHWAGSGPVGGAGAFGAQGELYGTDVTGGRSQYEQDSRSDPGDCFPDDGPLPILASARRCHACAQSSPTFSPALSTGRLSGLDTWWFDICTMIFFWRRLRLEKSGTGPSRPDIDKMRATIPGRLPQRQPEQEPSPSNKTGQPYR